MEQSELLCYLCTTLDKLGVRYFITGSHATIAYGEPRFTNYIDVVVDLGHDQLEAFCAAFPDEDYYLSRPTAKDAVAHKRQFNIIHPTSGLKIDVIVTKNTPHDRERLDRAVRLPIAPGVEASFSTPEDIILKKMEFHKMGGGDRHLRDIAGVIKVRGNRLDREYIASRAAQLNVADIWQAILARLEEAERSES